MLRYKTLKSLIQTLDRIVHDKGDTYMIQKENRRCSTYNVLHEASESIRELKHEKEMLTKTIQNLHYNHTDNDNDMNFNINRNRNPYPYHSNQSPFASRSRSQSPSCSSSLPLLLLEPSMSAFGIVLLKTALHGTLFD